MKSAIWRRSLKKYVMPNLPGGWDVARSILYREPVGWVVCYLTLSNSHWSSDYSVYAIVQLLAVPRKYQSSPSMDRLGHGAGQWWKAANTLTEAEPVMREILELIQAEALPVFDRLGSVSGYAAFVEDLARNRPPNHLFYEEVCYAHLIQGDIAGAALAAEAAHNAAHADGRQFSLEVSDRVSRTMDAAQRSLTEAIEMLRANADYARTHLGLPPMSEVPP